MDSRFTGDTDTTPQLHRTVHLCVDVQLGCVAGLSEKGAQDYLANMGEAIDGLRQRDVPTLWIAIDDATEMRPRSQGWSNAPDAPPRDLGSADMKPFTSIVGMAEKPANEGVYRQFLADHGPKAGEDIQHKRQLDAFASRKSLDENPKLYDHVTSHLKDETREKVDASFKGPSMADHLKAQGTDHVLISGMDAFVCALDTAVGAARNGLKVTVLTDGLACAGRGEFNDPDRAASPDVYRAHFEKLLDNMVNNPGALEGHGIFGAHAGGDILTPGDKKAIMENIDFSTSRDFIAALDAGPQQSSFLKADASPPSKPDGDAPKVTQARAP